LARLDHRAGARLDHRSGARLGRLGSADTLDA
jgi:hypothetical protein